MAFVDEIKIHLKAGDGGDGVVRWLHLKGKEFSGPAGGNGGRGGDVYLLGVRDRGALKKLVNKSKLEAQDGEDGRKKSQHGQNGDDLIVEVPVGSVVMNQQTGFKYEILEEGQKEKVLTGGSGGYGNEHFKASTNTRPKEYTDGRSGEDADFFIELQLIVDAGFVGFPNAGKSSLLNELTGARSQVAHYEFTTKEPHLGDLYGFILADIPGLLRGASKGKGLGYKFLRHINRTKALIHCVSFENEDVEKAYLDIRKELEEFNQKLLDKPEIIILTKSDLVDDDSNKESIDKMKKYSENVISTTILLDDSIKKLSDFLVQRLTELT